MSTTVRRTRSPLVGSLTHPVAPGILIALAALGIGSWQALGHPPILLAWVVLALAAGYSISGSV
ncbi:hypothetical protein [Actinopolymorpha pittospori]